MIDNKKSKNDEEKDKQEREEIWQKSDRTLDSSQKDAIRNHIRQ